MKTKHRPFLLILIFIAHLTGAKALSQTGLGRFVGTLEHKSLKKQQIAKIDFITSRESNGEIELSAILTLHFGDFRSKEYVAFYFSNVKYNLLTKKMIFDQLDQDATITVDSFDGENLVGEFRSTIGGDIGTLHLSKEGKGANVTLPLIETISGEYVADCDGKKQTLQLFTSRSDEHIANSISTNPFLVYHLKGYRGSPNPHCIGSSTDNCINGIYDCGEYNFYKDRLVLYGRPRPLICRTVPNGLQCDSCHYRRISQEASGTRQLTPLSHKETVLNDIIRTEQPLESVQSIEGEYYGYVFHERLNVYQPVSLDILTYQDSSGNGSSLKMSAVATMYFGEPDREEFLSSRFDTKKYPNPVGAIHFVFSSPEVDTILEVNHLGKGVVGGTWFSHLFGRVGEFKLQKGGYPNLPRNLPRMESLLGFYESSVWDVDLYVRNEVGFKSAVKTGNPFSPKTFDGGFIMKNGATPRLRITGGSYDFYTGLIALDVGGSFAVGERRSREHLRLRWLGTNYNTPLLPFDPQPFRFLGEIPQ